MTEIMNYIQRNYRTVSLEGLSGEFHLSVPYLSKYIREKSGKSFRTILTEIKMQHARHMLKTESVSVERIAEKAGYPSVEHFNRQFKKLYGITPAAYRNARE